MISNPHVLCVYPGTERYPLGKNLEALSLPAMAEEIAHHALKST